MKPSDKFPLFRSFHLELKRMQCFIVSTLLVFSTAIAVLAVPPASAYLPADLPANAQGDPEISAVLNHTTPGDQEPQPGGKFEYKGEIVFRNVLKPAKTQIGHITINQDPFAPFDTEPDQNSLNVSGASVTGFEKLEDDSWRWTIGDITEETTATITLPATVKQDSPEGWTVNASIKAELQALPEVALNPGPQKFVPDSGECSGTAYFSQTLKGGAWLVDVKFADANGNGLVGFVGDNEIVDGSTNPTAKNSIEFVLPDGYTGPSSDELLAKGRFLSSDGTKPVYAESEKILNENPDAKWLDSYSWNYDPATYTGDTWLPAGTTINVKRHIVFGNCLPGGFASDFDASRQFIVNIQIGRPAVDVSEGAADTFTLPGEPPVVKACEDIYYTESSASFGKSPLKNPTHFGRISNYTEGDLALARDLGEIKAEYNQFRRYDWVAAETGMIAVSSYDDGALKLSDKIFYNAGNRDNNFKASSWDLLSYRYADGAVPVSDDSRYTLYELSQPSSGAKAAPSANSAFDQNGRLWSFESGDTNGSRLYSVDIASYTGANSVRWNTNGNLPFGGNNDQVTDLVFDSAGNMIISKDNRNGTSDLYRIDAAQLANPGIDSTSELSYELVGTVDRKIWGLAWGSDGKLYLGNGAGRSLYRATLSADSSGGVSTGQGTINAEKVSGNFAAVSIHHDNASCNFGPNPTPGGSGPKFKVQKSAIDPVTGAVVPAGQASPNKVKFGADKTADVEFLVTVANTGSSEGVPPTIQDSFTAPSGFTIRDVTVDGETQGANGNFTLTSGSLKPAPEKGSSRSFRIQVKLSFDKYQDVSWSDVRECASGTPLPSDKGLFNSVDMVDDADGTDNNRACIPVTEPKTATLTLKKKIVNVNDREIGDVESDAVRDNFLLIAGANAPSAGTYEGTSLVKGHTGVSETVLAAEGEGLIYSLSEFPDYDDPDTAKKASQYQQYKKWSCLDSANKERVLSDSENANTVAVKPGDNITCTVKNTINSVYILKFANGGRYKNPHSGANVELDPQTGKGTLRYTIRVRSAMPAGHLANSGPIFDHFVLPEGLKWDQDWNGGKAKVSVGTKYAVSDSTNPDYPDPVVTGLRTALTEDELASGVQIVENISNVRRHGKPDPEADGSQPAFSYYLKIDIPVIADITRTEKTNSVGASIDSSVFHDHEQDLGQCIEGVSKGPLDSYILSKAERDAEDPSRSEEPGGGAINGGRILNEDQTSTAHAERDNYACIPVTLKNLWDVSKLAKTSEPGQFDIIGSPVKADQDGKVVAQYKIKIENKGFKPGYHPEITDSLKFHGGFEVESIEVNKYDASSEDGKGANVIPTRQLSPREANPAFTIPQGSEWLNKGEAQEYLVTASGRFNPAPVGGGSPDRSKAEVCENSSSASGFEQGLANSVSIDAQFGDDGSDNNACVPVAPPGSTGRDSEVRWSE